MSTVDDDHFNQMFRSQLMLLRERIEQLPVACSPALRSLADDMEAQHNEMQHECANLRNLVDDLRLAVKTARFNLWASQQDGKRRSPGEF